MIRNSLSVLSGFILWTVLFLGGNALLVRLMPSAFNEDGSTDSNGMLFVVLVLTVVYSVISGMTTARIAKTNAIRWGLVLGVLLLVVGIGVQLQFWGVLPLWYNLAFLSLLLPASWFGARLVSK